MGSAGPLSVPRARAARSDRRRERALRVTGDRVSASGELPEQRAGDVRLRPGHGGGPGCERGARHRARRAGSRRSRGRFRRDRSRRSRTLRRGLPRRTPRRRCPPRRRPSASARWSCARPRSAVRQRERRVLARVLVRRQVEHRHDRRGRSLRGERDATERGDGDRKSIRSRRSTASPAGSLRRRSRAARSRRER